ncbi:MAG TPA: rhomboid family intramembrane serine protease [Polyangiaceae bacterium]|jgi:membrane associated rhomboid family serine protease
MREAEQQVAFPRPGRGVKALLVVYVAIALVGALLFNYGGHGGAAVLAALACIPALVVHHPWSVLTAGLLTSPRDFTSIIITAVAIYFLAPDLERRWGMWRFFRFYALSIIAGFGLALVLAKIAPGDSQVFHPGAMFGPAAALTALAVAWGRENASAQIRLYFLLPISGRMLVWITLGFCALGLFFPATLTEGVVAPFGGFVAGLLLAGSPSPLREIYLRVKLAVLRRRSGPIHIEGIRPQKRRPGAPPLRVVTGGLDEDLEKRQPPKDKRFLN